MLTPSRSRRVFAYQKPCDMRKQYDSLAALVSEAMSLDCLNGDLFLFVGRTRTRAKVLYFDGTGMCGACRVSVGGSTKFVCVDGPEFDAHQVDFDEMIMRLGAYKDIEKK